MSTPIATAKTAAERLADLTQQLADAEAERAAADADLARIVRDEPLDGLPSDQRVELAGRRRGAELAIRRITAQLDAARIEAREELESANVETLVRFNDDLDAAGARLADAERAAEAALRDLLAASADYLAEHERVRAQLLALGFDRSSPPAGAAPWRTASNSVGGTVVIAGASWPTLAPISALAWAVGKVAAEAGQSGRILAGQANSQVGLNRRHLDELFADVPKGRRS